MEKTALVVIEVQKDYFPKGRCELYRAEAALDRVNALLYVFRRAGQPVFLIQHIAGEGAPFFALHTEGSDLHPALHLQETESVFIKHEPNSFYQTGLEERLRRDGVSRLVICGMTTHMCVDTTVRAAYDRGFAVTVAADACATKALVWQGMTVPAPVVQTAYLAAIDGTFARCVDTAEILASIPE